MDPHLKTPGPQNGSARPIHDVKLFSLRRIPDERGCVLHMLKSTDPYFSRFGEIYFSMAFPGAIKAWHLHKKMTIRYAVPVGNIKLVCYDPRKDSPTFGAIQEIFTGESHYQLVLVPPGVVNGFVCTGDRPALVANCADIPHDPGEIVRINPFTPEIPYIWGIRHG